MSRPERRRVFTDAAWNVEIGQRVGDVTWERIVPGDAWVVLSRGFWSKPNDGNPLGEWPFEESPSRGMWLLLEAR